MTEQQRATNEFDNERFVGVNEIGGRRCVHKSARGKGF